MLDFFAYVTLLFLFAATLIYLSSPQPKKTMPGNEEDEENVANRSIEEDNKEEIQKSSENPTMSTQEEQQLSIQMEKLEIKRNEENEDPKDLSPEEEEERQQDLWRQRLLAQECEEENDSEKDEDKEYEDRIAAELAKDMENLVKDEDSEPVKPDSSSSSPRKIDSRRETSDSNTSSSASYRWSGFVDNPNEDGDVRDQEDYGDEEPYNEYQEEEEYDEEHNEDEDVWPQQRREVKSDSEEEEEDDESDTEENRLYEARVRAYHAKVGASEGQESAPQEESVDPQRSEDVEETQDASGDQGSDNEPWFTNNKEEESDSDTEEDRQYAAKMQAHYAGSTSEDVKECSVERDAKHQLWFENILRQECNSEEESVTEKDRNYKAWMDKQMEKEMDHLMRTLGGVENQESRQKEMTNAMENLKHASGSQDSPEEAILEKKPKTSQRIPVTVRDVGQSRGTRSAPRTHQEPMNSGSFPSQNGNQNPQFQQGYPNQYNDSDQYSRQQSYGDDYNDRPHHSSRNSQQNYRQDQQYDRNRTNSNRSNNHNQRNHEPLPDYDQYSSTDDDDEFLDCTFPKSARKVSDERPRSPQRDGPSNRNPFDGVPVNSGRTVFRDQREDDNEISTRPPRSDSDHRGYQYYQGSQNLNIPHDGSARPNSNQQRRDNGARSYKSSHSSHSNQDRGQERRAYQEPRGERGYMHPPSYNTPDGRDHGNRGHHDSRSSHSNQGRSSAQDSRGYQEPRRNNHTMPPPSYNTPDGRDHGNHQDNRDHRSPRSSIPSNFGYGHGEPTPTVNDNLPQNQNVGVRSNHSAPHQSQSHHQHNQRSRNTHEAPQEPSRSMGNQEKSSCYQKCSDQENQKKVQEKREETEEEANARRAEENRLSEEFIEKNKQFINMTDQERLLRHYERTPHQTHIPSTRNHQQSQHSSPPQQQRAPAPQNFVYNESRQGWGSQSPNSSTRTGFTNQPPQNAMVPFNGQQQYPQQHYGQYQLGGYQQMPQQNMGYPQQQNMYNPQFNGGPGPSHVQNYQGFQNPQQPMWQMHQMQQFQQPPQIMNQNPQFYSQGPPGLPAFQGGPPLPILNFTNESPPTTIMRQILDYLEAHKRAGIPVYLSTMDKPPNQCPEYYGFERFIKAHLASVAEIKMENNNGRPEYRVHLI